MTTSLTERPAAATTTSRPAAWFRGDVDGLRAIAIILVVGYHAGIPLFHGGFIGVDVFFVISGFLISRNLLRESETSQRVGLGGFWSRRIRRLVPALGLVVATTLIVGSFIVPRFDLEGFARQGASATLYVSNMLFASEAQNYFAADVSGSPFLHTWSLGVEEQFYLVWPLVFAAACLGLRHLWPDYANRQRRRILAGIFGLTLVGSLALSVSLTNSGSTWAFFGLPSRTWEFAAAGLLAVLPVPSFLRHVVARTALAVAGLAVLVVGLVVISDATAYPGLWALLPVGATALIIVAGETWDGTARVGPVSAALSLPPAQWLGRVSYSWYLWHWPAIVLLVIATGDDSVGPKTIAALASLPVAWLAYKYFETPLRFSSLLARSHRRTYLVGAVITAVVLLVAGAVYVRAPKVSADMLAGVDAPSGASLDERVALNVALYRSRVDNSCPSGLLKSPAGDQYCIGGDPAGTKTVMLIGDSHAGQWRKVLDEVAKLNGVKLITRQHSGCPPYKVLLDDGKGGGLSGDKAVICGVQQAGDLRILDLLRPDAVVIAAATSGRPFILDESGAIASEEDQKRIWRTGVSGFLDELTNRNIAVGWILDEPTLQQNASQCIVAQDSVEACVPDRASALMYSAPLLDVEREELAKRNITTTIDMTDIICDDQRCNLEIDGALVYVDSHHLTDAFAARQQPAIADLVSALLGA